MNGVTYIEESIIKYSSTVGDGIDWFCISGKEALKFKKSADALK